MHAIFRECRKHETRTLGLKAPPWFLFKEPMSSKPAPSAASKYFIRKHRLNLHLVPTESTCPFVIRNNWKVQVIHFTNFNFIKNVYFLPDGRIKLHKHCQQVESSDVYIPTTEASKPVYNFVTDVQKQLELT